VGALPARAGQLRFEANKRAEADSLPTPASGMTNKERRWVKMGRPGEDAPDLLFCFQPYYIKCSRVTITRMASILDYILFRMS
jgi:hypothetical protein